MSYLFAVSYALTYPYKMLQNLYLLRYEILKNGSSNAIYIKSLVLGLVIANLRISYY